MTTIHRHHRTELMQALPGGLILFKSGHDSLRNGDVSHVFRQESNFLYLTGITEPNHVLLLDSLKKKSHLFIPDQSEFHQIWIGRQITCAEAKKKYQVDFVWPHSQFTNIFSKLKKSRKKIHSTKKIGAELAKLRRIKSPQEIAFLLRANKISYQGHVAAMQAAKAGLYEYQLQAILENEFRMQGAFHNAYPSIVASGHNAAILHYHANNQKIKKDDLILIDAGCEWYGYASDIARTFPASGKFNKIQREIYQLVLSTQKTCIQSVEPGVSIQIIHDLSCRLLLQGMIELEIVKKFPLDELITNNIHRIFYPHGVGHLLGLDVHDVGGESRKPSKKSGYLRAGLTLEAGMVITVEPGLYFIEAIIHSKEKRKKYQKYINWKMVETYSKVGGIRIEDNILVTKNGFKNLTKVPKEVAAIEKLMSQR